MTRRECRAALKQIAAKSVARVEQHDRLTAELRRCRERVAYWGLKAGKHNNPTTATVARYTAWLTRLADAERAWGEFRQQQEGER